jgi:hypothetical protein
MARATGEASGLPGDGVEEDMIFNPEKKKPAEPLGAAGFKHHNL